MYLILLMKQQLHGVCLSQLLHTKTVWNYPWRNPGKHYQPTGMTSRAPGTIAPPQVTVVGTRLFVPPSRVPAIYEGRNHVLVRPSNLSPLVKHKKLGITTQGHNPQNLSLVPEAGPSTSGSTDHEVTPNTPQRCIRWLTLTDFHTGRNTCIIIRCLKLQRFYVFSLVFC